MGTLQKNNKRKIQELVLYLSSQEPLRIELAHGTPLSKGVTWGFFKVRFAGATPPMLQLQYKPRGSRSTIHRKHETNRR